MDKAKAIELLKLAVPIKALTQQEYSDFIEAINMAIDALKAQLSSEDATFDTISRQAVIDEIKSVYEWHDTVTMERLIEHLNNLPPIQPERKKGEWLPDNNNAYEMRFVCSCCKESEVVPTIGFTKYKTLWDFCPNCGADMRGEKDG